MRPRPPTNPEALLAFRVGELRDQFAYPDEIGGGAPAVGGGGGGAPTIVIAASDASDFSKSKADFICVGLNDHEVINAAVTASPSVGARIILTEGTFNISTSQIILNKDIHLMGMGWEKTIISTTASSGFLIHTSGALSTIISDLTLQGGGGTTLGLTLGVDCIVRYCQGVNLHTMINADGSNTGIFGCTAPGVERFVDVANNADHVVIEGNFNVGRIRCGTAQFVSIIGNSVLVNGLDCILLEGTQQTKIVGNTLQTFGGYGVNMPDDSIEQVVISGNNFFRCDSGAISGLGAFMTTITGNVIQQSPGSGTGAAIEFDDSATPGAPSGDGLIISNNIIENTVTDGIKINAYRNVQIIGNQLREVNGHGIVIEASSDSVISANLIISPGANGDNTFDGILVSGDSDDNFITGNQIFGASAAPRPRYAINISAATCDCNRVVGNSGGEAAEFGTAPINDAGTLTQLFWPADPSDGDNIFGCSGS